MIEYILLNVFILELKIYCGPDKFYGRSKLGQYYEAKNRAPFIKYTGRYVDYIDTFTGGSYNFKQILSQIQERDNDCILLISSYEGTSMTLTFLLED